MLFGVLPLCFISVCAFLTHRAPIDRFCVFTFCFISVCAFFDPRDRDPSVPHRMRRPRPAADPVASSYRKSPHRNRWRFKRVHTVAPNLTRRAPSPPPPRSTGNHPTLRHIAARGCARLCKNATKSAQKSSESEPILKRLLRFL